MSFITPVDGQPAIAEHVAQLTQALSGARAEPITLTSTLTLTDTTLSRPAAGALRVAGAATANVDLNAGATTADSNLTWSKAGSLRWNLVTGNDASGSPLVLYDHGASGAGFTERLRLTHAGVLTVAPDAGQAALVVGGAVASAASSNLALSAGSGGNIAMEAPANWTHPARDNAIGSGHPSFRWSSVYAVNGTIQTSSVAYKEGVTPLDPARAMDAVRATEAVTFDYLAPARTAEWYDLPDDPEQAQRVLEDRLQTAPLEAAARHQHGFIAEDCDPLFLVGAGQTSPGSSIGVLLAALQHLDARLTALEGAA